MNVLVFNVGSTTLKYACVDTASGFTSESGNLDRIGQPEGDAATHIAAAEAVIAKVGWEKIDSIGHRIVQGGSQFEGPTLVDPTVLTDLRKLDSLAPLHNPPARKVVEGLIENPLPQVLVFDTSYFSSLAPEAYRYAIPDSWFLDYGVRRYGFHGTSHEFVTHQAIGILGGNEVTRCISMHLGGGASITASVGGKAVDTSMGMTPLQGLVMATRSGDIDPAIPLYMIEAAGVSASQIRTALNRESGLVGLCGEGDMRGVLKRRSEGDSAATLAIDIYVRSIVKHIGSYFAVLGGLDCLVFTAGVGEHAHEIRQLVTAPLEHLGVKICQQANVQRNGELADISSADSSIKILVIPTNEELAIAQKVSELLSSSDGIGNES
jgi:acetate kinase